jgi:hypothetical protein
MFCCSSPLGVLRSLVYLSLLGFAVTVLIGPAVAVAGTLLPFALIGGLAYGGYRLAALAVRRIRGERLPVVRVEEAAPVRPEPVLFCPEAEEPLAAKRQPGRMGRLARSAIHVGIEVGCGAALGAALCVLAEWQGGPGAAHPALGAAIGAVVGFVVGGSRPRDAAECADEGAEASCRAA